MKSAMAVPGEAERRLLLCCVARNARDEEIHELAMQPLDWNSLLISALWHKIAFIVYERMRALGALDLALTSGNLHLLLLNHWKQLTKVNTERSRLYIDVAVTVCAAAEELGVDLAVSKGGVALFGHTYTPGERKVYDIDFIGRRAELHGIEEAFARAGFRFGEYCHSAERIDPPRPGDLRKHLLQGRGLPNLIHRPDSKVIDYLVAQVRFRIGSGSRDGNWVDATPLLEHAIHRDDMRVVDWPDLALQLALHIHREANEYQTWSLDWNLIKMCDFDRIIHCQSLCGSVPALVKRAVKLGFTEELAFAAAATNAILPSPTFREILVQCGDVNPIPDPLTVQNSVWEVGTTPGTQKGAWVALVGVKTT